MTISELRKQPHISTSAISDYISCGLHYKFGKIDKIKSEIISEALIFGSTIHKVLEMFYLCKMEGAKMPLSEMLNHFEEQWKKAAEKNSIIKFKEGKSYTSVMEEGKALLTVYFENLPEDNFQVLAIEEPFSFNIPGIEVPFIGVIDLLLEDSDGTIIISDNKTSAKSYAASDVDKSLQLTLYGMAVKASGYSDREILLRFDCLIKTKVPKFEQYYTARSDADERKAVKLIQTAWDGIQKGVFIPTDSWKCNFCEFHVQCKKWFDS